MIAVMLVDKNVTFRSAHDTARMKDPAILKQRAKVELVPDADLQKRMPSRQAVVEVTLTNGMKLTERVEAVKGTVENPMTRDEVVAKARELITPVLGATTPKLIDRVLNLESVKNVRELRPVLQRT
jgi:2-methylcitrate dehydratase PrpD